MIFNFDSGTKITTIDQIHRVTEVIEKAFEEKKYSTTVFLDVSQTFDRACHGGLNLKISQLLSQNYCQLLESYLANQIFRVIHEEANSSFYLIQAGVLQGSVLGPILYIR